jgi:iron(III) transport system substrate-binding protein
VKDMCKVSLKKLSSTCLGLHGLLLICMLIGLTFMSGCVNQNTSNGDVIVSSSMNQKFMIALLESYNKSGKYKLRLETDPAKPADCYLDTLQNVKNLSQNKKLEPSHIAAQELVNEKFKDSQGLWSGVFYDPVVFLINQQYSRIVGQGNILTWYDLPKLRTARLAVEAFNDTASTREFMAAMASHMGQAEFFTYLKSLKPMIKQYGKFPITPIRMVVGGDADIALTRQSYLAQYVESDFPAYVQMPANGTAITLYVLGLAQDSKHKEACEDFLKWLLQNNEAQKVIQPFGYLPVVPQADTDSTVNIDGLWLNTFYKNQPAIDGLADNWLKSVRFAEGMGAK